MVIDNPNFITIEIEYSGVTVSDDGITATFKMPEMFAGIYNI
jgi:hypothetical protein